MNELKAKVDEYVNVKMTNEIKAKVDEYVKWDNLLAEAKREIEKMKAEFQKKGLELMADRKIKQVEFWGNENSKVVVTATETLKLVSYQLLQDVIGERILKDFVKEETQYRLSEPFKRLLTAVSQGNYVEQPAQEIINQLTNDEKTRLALKKKLKGNWDKDVKSLQAIAGLGRDEAEHYAYFIQEAMNYEKMAHLLRAAGYEPGGQAFVAAMENVRHAVVVEEGIKVGVESEGSA